MLRTHEILIIGTEPPCPRCDLLVVLIERIASTGLTITFRHCSFDSPEASAFGQQHGFKSGTARHVSKDAGIPVDWDAVYDVIDRKKSSLPPHGRPADAWSPDLDGLLEPCRQAAKSAGYLMTPVLVINGKVVHFGSVPSSQQLAAWLSE
jgi:hypothetical protein